MSEIVLSIENISKVYNLGKIGTGTFHNEISKILRFKKNNQNINANDTIRSLNNISFNVSKGDSIGLIGRNGAGKSTLLKILSRITTPTEGSIKGKGRIASLLEVGTGFHPELSGKENIFLNGSILGMKNHEIKANFDEIVDFSGIEKFLNTPVKRYSSGMYVRLAFAVAAHLNSEILIVDEVLAVGDAEFQKKCLNKMGSIKDKEGRTVIFVSHNMNAISTLCNKTILLEKGELIEIGKTEKIINNYLNKPINSIPILNRTDRIGDGSIKIISICLFDIENNKIVSSPISGKDYLFKIKLLIDNENKTDFSKLEIALGINDIYGNRVSLISNKISGDEIYLSPNNAELNIKIHKLSLCLGSYSVNTYIATNGIIHDWTKDAFTFNIEIDNYFSKFQNLGHNGKGYFHLDYSY
jgi:lipopolysaccharide transport system ATP-binding protein